MGSNAIALQVQPPAPQPGALDQYGKLVSLQSLLSGQKTQQLQQQGLEQENQLRTQQLADQQAATAAMKQWNGSSLDDLPGLLLKNGASAQAVFGMRNQIVDQKTKLAALDKDTLANQAGHNDALLGSLQAASSVPDNQLASSLMNAAQDAVQKGHLDPQHMQMVQQVAQLPPDQMRAQLDIFEKSLMGQKEQFEQVQKAQETGAQVTAANARQLGSQTEAAKLAAQQNPSSPLYSPTTAAVALGASQNNPTMQAIQTGEAKQAGRAAGAEAAAKFPYELKLKQEEMAQNPVFAVNPKTGQRELTTVGDAKAAGLTNPIKVSQTNVEQETTLNAQLNDLQLNLSRYKAALNAMGPLSRTDVANMTHILSDPNVNSGLLNNIGMPSVISMMEQGGKAADWNALSPDKQQALIGALRMKNSALLFQKVSTGMGRASKEAMDIEIANMPAPIEGATVGNQKLQAFQENVDQMASRSVKLPWMDQPQDVRARIEQQAVDAYNAAHGINAGAPSNRPTSGGIPAGATMRVPGSDGRLHWSDGRRDLGVAQ